jgi:hypothetical protein
VLPSFEGKLRRDGVLSDRRLGCRVNRDSYFRELEECVLQ